MPFPLTAGINGMATFFRIATNQFLCEEDIYLYKVEPVNLKSAKKERLVTEARRDLCYIAVRKLGYKCTDVSRTLGISAVTVSKAVSLGSKLSLIGKIQKQIVEN